MVAEPSSAIFHVLFEGGTVRRGGRGDVRHDDDVILGEVPVGQQTGADIHDPALAISQPVEEFDGLVGEIPVGFLHIVGIVEQRLESGRLAGITGRADIRCRDEGGLLGGLLSAGGKQQERRKDG